MYAAVVFLALFGALVSADSFSNFPSASAPAGGSSYNAFSSSAYNQNNNLQCSKEYEYFEKCASPCEETCFNTQYFFEMKNKDDCSLRNCVPRCKCVSGYVRNNQDRCVPKSQCSMQQDYHHGFRGNRQPYFYPQQQFDSQFDNFQYSASQYGNQYDAGNYYNDYNKY